MNGETPLHKAAERGEVAVAHFLLDRGAMPDVGNKQGVAPIDLAAAPRDEVGEGMAPDVDLLGRMMRGSGALVVLAAKMVAADSKRQELGDRRTSIFKFDVLQSTPRSPRS